VAEGLVSLATTAIVGFALLHASAGAGSAPHRQIVLGPADHACNLVQAQQQQQLAATAAAATAAAAVSRPASLLHCQHLFTSLNALSACSSASHCAGPASSGAHCHLC